MQIVFPNELLMNQFSAVLAKELTPGLKVYLHGDLGAGKTTLVREVLRQLGASGAIKSPTYALIETYPLKAFPVHHIDLYRIADPEELEYIGLDEYFSEDSVTFIEWPEKGGASLPPPDLKFHLNYLSEGEGRSMKISANTPQGEARLHELEQRWGQS
jgi:tRNA threonylcarbamoyladenosine biosynthesis protein TsaE